MNASGIFKLQFLVFADEIVKVRLVLEEIGIQFLVVEGQIRLDVIAEFDDLKINVLLGQERFDDLQDLRVGNRRRADLEGRFRPRRRGSRVGGGGGFAAVAAAR